MWNHWWNLLSLHVFEITRIEFWIMTMTNGSNTFMIHIVSGFGALSPAYSMLAQQARWDVKKWRWELSQDLETTVEAKFLWHIVNFNTTCWSVCLRYFHIFFVQKHFPKCGSLGSIKKPVGRKYLFYKMSSNLSRDCRGRWRSSIQSPTLWAPHGQGPVSKMKPATVRWMTVANLPLMTPVKMCNQQTRLMTKE